jgi:preprotein translocase subunit SecE
MVQRLKNYMSEAYNELMFKVSWPSWAELQGSVTVVCVASLIVAVLVYAMDVGSNSLLTNFYKLFN